MLATILRRRLQHIEILLVLTLSACAGQAAQQGTPTALLPTRTAPPPTPIVMECVIVSAAATDAPTEQPLFPAPTADDWSAGPVDAEVTFLEYTDLQAAASPTLDLNLAKLAAKYPQTIRRVFRHFPLPADDKAILAAAAAEAAGKQKHFWEMAQILLSSQPNWVELKPDAFRAWLLKQAQTLSLDEKSFSKDLDDAGIQSRLKQAQQFGLDARIPTMPFLLVNGKIYQGPRDLRSLENLVTLLSMGKHQFTECPPFQIDIQKQYLATLKTEKGTVVIQLFPQKAPLAVNNFVFLARQGWYNGVTFHRVIPEYVAQTGDPSGSGYGGPGYAFADDTNDLVFDKPGMVAMVNSGPNSNGSQFFITYKAIPGLNGLNTIFGQVIQGQDVISRLTPRDPASPENLPDGDKIQTILIEEK
jgi:cyclophilin family peptidyl-prolyl cis-trans isomerase/protein-disulfide isomerase